MRNINDYGITTAEWLASIHNIDLLDPDADYICGLRPRELTRESKDSILGNGSRELEKNDEL